MKASRLSTIIYVSITYYKYTVNCSWEVLFMLLTHADIKIIYTSVPKIGTYRQVSKSEEH